MVIHGFDNDGSTYGDDTIGLRHYSGWSDYSIPISPNIQYHMTLEKTTQFTLSVYLDSERTVHTSDSPIFLEDDPTITHLQYLQHTSWVSGPARHLTAEVDNTLIYTTNSEFQNAVITICHKPDTDVEKTLQIPDSAVKAHLSHDDVLGNCSEKYLQLILKPII